MNWRVFRKLRTPIAAGIGLALATAYLYQNFPLYNNHVIHALRSSNNNDHPGGVNPCSYWNRNWDGRDPEYLVQSLVNVSAVEKERYKKELSQHPPSANRHIILVRHGEYNKYGLTNLGRTQANYTGNRLRDMNIQFTNIIVSTMQRAQETASIILPKINHNPKYVQNCDLVCEGRPIEPNPPTIRVQKVRLSGARIEAGFRRYFYRASPEQKSDSYTLIIGHANVFRYFVCRALQLPPEAWLRMSINHGSITWLSIGPDGHVAMRLLGDTGFMPPNLVTM